MVSLAGAVLPVETVRKSDLDDAISVALTPWRKPRAVHDPGKVLLDAALGVALGGDCLADVAMLRAEPDVFGPVASDPTVSRLIDALAAAGPKALTTIRSARAEVRSRVRELAGANGPAADGHVIVDIDGVLVLAHSEKQDATATWKEDLRPSSARRVRRPRPGRFRRAGGRAAAARQRRLQHRHRPHRNRPTRPGPAPRTPATGTGRADTDPHRLRMRHHAFLDWLSRRGRWLSYSVGMTITDAIHHAVLNIPEKAWTPAYDPGTERPGARVAEITDMPDLSSWPTGTRLIVRKERLHPGAQLRLTDVDGTRLTRFATDTKGGRLATLELRHRRRARCEDRIRNARDTGLPKPAPARHCPEPDLAGDRLPRAGPPGLDADARSDRRPRRWEPKKLRLRLFSAAAQLINTGRRRCGTRRPPDTTTGPSACPAPGKTAPRKHRVPASEPTRAHERSRLVTLSPAVSSSCQLQ